MKSNQKYGNKDRHTSLILVAIDILTRAHFCIVEILGRPPKMATNHILGCYAGDVSCLQRISIAHGGEPTINLYPISSAIYLSFT